MEKNGKYCVQKSRAKSDETQQQKSNHLLTQTIAPNFTMKNLSGYSDSNGGPPAPKAGALSQLRHTPNPLKGAANVKLISVFAKLPLFFLFPTDIRDSISTAQAISSCSLSEQQSHVSSQ